MAPLAENKRDFSPTQVSRPQNAVAQGPPEKNIALALNYELPLVDQFLAETRKPYRRDSTASTFGSPVATNSDHVSSAVPAKQQPASISEEGYQSGETQPPAPQQQEVLMTPPPQLSVGRRVSTRDKKRTPNLARSRVRYDLQLVPRVGRNQPFLDQFHPWWRGRGGADEAKQKPVSRRSLRVTENGHQCATSNPQQPFLKDHSTIWIPADRREWEDTVSELTALCTQAGIRRHPGNGAPFVRPLSQEYIRDRIDIDDPLMGFQLRHREGGWLQGFVMYTNFTTWNHGFRWDSLHPASGVSATRSMYKDKDGSIAIELESEPRFGDLSAGGIVFPSVAEIGLLGGLGCGEYLLRMALDNIRERKEYKFVVLQATDQSKAFYERFGFVRVGAVCQYGKGAVLLDLAGYRHWTHANESEISLEKHGGPSYMMCLKIPPVSETTADQPAAETSFLEHMMALRVDRKPMIVGLGTAATPAPKVFKRIAIENAPSSETIAPPPVALSTTPLKKKPGPKPGRKRGRPPKARPGTPATAPRTPKKAGSVPKPNKRRADLASPPARKRRKTTSNVLTPYVEKQYSDIWLAVPATKPPSLANLPVKRKRGRPRIHFPPGHPQHQPQLRPSKKKSTPPRMSIGKNGHRFHAVRGPDGKFIRVAIDGSPPSSSRPRSRDKMKRDSVSARKKGTRTQPSRTPPKSTEKAPRRKSPASKKSSPLDNEPNAPVFFIPSIVPGKPQPIDKMSIRKQKVKAYPRDREHFFNRVVRMKTGPDKGKIFFVLECEEETGRVCLIPMLAEGVLSGKREGRPRYQCVLGDTDADFVLTEEANCELIRSAMVMKTSLVAVEAWDLQTPDDLHFETR